MTRLASYDSQIVIRIPLEDRLALEKIAESEDRSLGYIVRRAIRLEIARGREQGGGSLSR